MLPKSRRLRLTRDFDKVFSLGKSLSGQYLKIKFLKKGSLAPRFAVVVSNKVSKRAVVRNRLRRQLWSLIAKIDNASLNGLDIVIIVSPEAAVSSFSQITEDFNRLMTKRRL